MRPRLPPATGYAFRNRAGQVTYVGRASGAGNPDRVLARRLSRGHDHSQEGLTPHVIAVQKMYAANRGAEEFFIEAFRDRGASLVVSYIDAFIAELME